MGQHSFPLLYIAIYSCHFRGAPWITACSLTGRRRRKLLGDIAAEGMGNANALEGLKTLSSHAVIALVTENGVPSDFIPCWKC